MNIDFKKFHKIECDDSCTTLVHPNGHEIKISHKSLSSENKKQLDELPLKMAKGGKAKYSQQYDPNIQGSKASGISKSSNNMPGSPTEAKDAYTEPNAMGTSIPKSLLQHEMENKQQPDVVVNALNKKAPPFGPLGADPSRHYPPCINPSCKSFGYSHPNCQCYGGKFAKGGKVGNFCDTDRKHDDNCQYFADAGEVQPSPTPGQLPPEIDPSVNMPEPQATPGAAEELSGSPQDANAPTDQQQAPPPQDYGNDVEGELKAAEDAANPPGQDSQVQAAVAPTPPPSPVQTAQNTTSMLHNESQQVQQDLAAGHIHAKTYKELFDDKSVPGKIGTIFGLLLGGAGAGLSHQPNMLMTMMDNEINRDLDAQQKSSQNKQNFMKIANEGLVQQANATGQNIANATNARALAWSYASRMYLHDEIQRVMNLPEGSPQRAAGMQALTILNQGIDKKEADMFSQAGLAQAIQESSRGTGNTSFMKSGFMGPQMKELGEDIESKTVPGFGGKATAPLQPNEKAELRSGAVFDSAMNDLLSWTKAHPNGAIKGSPEDQRGRALAGIVQGKFREATNGGVYKSGEQDFINKLVPEDPTKAFNAYRVLPRLQAVQKEMSNQTDAKAKSYGLKGYSGMQPSAQQQNSQLKTINGAQYRKVSGGWQKVK